ncbi:hypothetical protein ACQKWADRAFT_320463 [Trichoderma austrokoningii]
MSRIFQIVRPAFKLSYQILAPDGEEPLYAVKNQPLPGNRPDLALHSGPDPASPILVSCYMPKFSRHCKIGFGDPTSGEPMVWEDLFKPKKSSCERTISVSLSSGDIVSETGQGEREQFTWKRTNHVCVPGKKLHKATKRNRKFVDERGEVVAIFTHAIKVGVEGWLQIKVDRGRDFDVLVMITALAICEKIRRQ